MAITTLFIYGVVLVSIFVSIHLIRKYWKGNEKKIIGSGCLMVLIILIFFAVSNITGNNSLEGKWIRTDGTYIEFDEDGYFSSNNYDIFGHSAMLDKPINEYDGTYQNGEKDITFNYIEKYEWGERRFSAGEDYEKDREETFQYKLDRKTLEITNGIDKWTFDRE